VSTLLVCSVGGHLAQLHRLSPQLEGVEDERIWVTFDCAQSRSLLSGEKAVLLDYVGPRDVRGVLRHAVSAVAMFGGRGRFSSVVSTGSGIALSFLPVGRAHGASCHYIESFTRTDGPSLTGRLLGTVPGVKLYSQYPGWARGPWRYAGSVFDSFAVGPPLPRPARIARAVVTIGTMRDYPFARLIERLVAVLDAGTEVLWQVGCTDVAALGIEGHREIPQPELSAAIADADVVVAHAGCGSAMAALTAGKVPVLVPREAARGENVDDHQRLLAAELSRRRLAIVRDAGSVTLEDLTDAAARSVSSAPASRFRLDT